MGNPPGEKYIPGAGCANCWGDGKTFGVGDPPEKVYITWSGLTGGLITANKSFVGIQHWFWPCVWEFQDADWQGYYQFQAGQTLAFLEVRDGGPPSNLLTGGICVKICTLFDESCTIS